MNLNKTSSIATYEVKLKFLENIFDFYKALQAEGVKCNIETLKETFFVRRYKVSVMKKDKKVLERLFGERIKAVVIA